MPSILGEKKSGGSLRLLCDWRELNSITGKNEACLPGTDDLFDTIAKQGNTFFTKLNLHDGYNLVRVRESDIRRQPLIRPLAIFSIQTHGVWTVQHTRNAHVSDESRPLAQPAEICCRLLTDGIL